MLRELNSGSFPMKMLLPVGSGPSFSAAFRSAADPRSSLPGRLEYSAGRSHAPHCDWAEFYAKPSHRRKRVHSE
jgi:hypothetical protein